MQSVQVAKMQFKAAAAAQHRELVLSIYFGFIFVFGFKEHKIQLNNSTVPTMYTMNAWIRKVLHGSVLKSKWDHCHT